MASSIESSYGAKLRKAQDLLTYIQSFAGYAPPRTQESVAGFTALITSISTSNTTTANSLQQYKSAVASRQNAYKGTATSIDKLLSPIKGAVDAQFGKKSPESAAIASQIKTMRATKLVKLPTDPTKTEQEKTVSQSERSHGSIVQNFNNLINTLQQFSGFNPSNNNLKIATLQTTSAQVTTLNNTVAQRIVTLKTAQSSRAALYADLNDRVQRIKSYVKAQYGIKSNEYSLIKGIKI